MDVVLQMHKQTFKFYKKVILSPPLAATNTNTTATAIATATAAAAATTTIYRFYIALIIACYLIINTTFVFDYSIGISGILLPITIRVVAIKRPPNLPPTRQRHSHSSHQLSCNHHSKYFPQTKKNDHRASSYSDIIPTCAGHGNGSISNVTLVFWKAYCCIESSSHHNQKE
jgi:hypothetical protein